MSESYCTVEEVEKMSGVKPGKMGSQYKEDREAFITLINDWIKQAESHINSYCSRNWYDYIKDGETIEVTVPDAVKNVTIRLVSNIIAFNYSRRDNPIKQVNDYSMTIFSSEIFTDDLKRDLKPFKKSSKIKVFKI